MTKDLRKQCLVGIYKDSHKIVAKKISPLQRKELNTVNIDIARYRSLVTPRNRMRSPAA